MRQISGPLATLSLLALSFTPSAFANTIINYSASGVPSAPTTGFDPYGNQWQISQFGVDSVWGIPGLPHVFSGAGAWQWLGPDCLVSITVRAWLTDGPLAVTPLPIDSASGLNLFRNVSLGANFLSAVSGNTITFTAPTPADIIRTGQLVNSGVFVSNPTGANANLRFDVTYEVLDHNGVPEPATLALSGAALFAIGLLRTRHHNVRR